MLKTLTVTHTLHNLKHAFGVKTRVDEFKLAEGLVTQYLSDGRGTLLVDTKLVKT